MCARCAQKSFAPPGGCASCAHGRMRAYLTGPVQSGELGSLPCIHLVSPSGCTIPAPWGHRRCNRHGQPTHSDLGLRPCCPRPPWGERENAGSLARLRPAQGRQALAPQVSHRKLACALSPDAMRGGHGRGHGAHRQLSGAARDQEQAPGLQELAPTEGVNAATASGFWFDQSLISGSLLQLVVVEHQMAQQPPGVKAVADSSPPGSIVDAGLATQPLRHFREMTVHARGSDVRPVKMTGGAANRSMGRDATGMTRRKAAAAVGLPLLMAVTAGSVRAIPRLDLRPYPAPGTGESRWVIQLPGVLRPSPDRRSRRIPTTGGGS